MRKLTALSFVSLDGVMQGPGGPDEDRSGGFVHGGWAVPHFDAATIDLISTIAARADALLLGRGTYEIFAATWPLAEPDDPIGARMNEMRKYVVSRTLTSVSWRNSIHLTGDLPESVEELKRGEGGEIQVHGSPGLLQSLIALDLVDEFHVFTFPVLVGSGVRLFGAGTGPARLRLDYSVRLKGGVVANTYVRDGALTYGAMGPETGNW